jgi:tetratricopeptide (TPR) repeat protein
LETGAELVPGYRLITLIGKGGSGEVWKVKGPGGLPLAMKFIPLASSAAAIELRSLRLVRALRHVNLITVFGVWQSRGFLAVAMELANGTLWDRYRQATQAGEPGIPKPELMEYLWEAAKAIDYLNQPRHCLQGHKRVGVQHCDIKPHNLLLIGGRVKVSDFGLARIAMEQAPATSILGTFVYSAPECFQGQTSRQSDQYALAVTYCQLRGGRLPFTGNVWGVMLGHSFDPPDLEMLPDDAERAVVARALAKRPEQRWADCGTFVRELKGEGPHRGQGAGVKGQRLAPRCLPLVPLLRPPHSVRRGVMIGLMALLGVLVCAGTLNRLQEPARAIRRADARDASAAADQRDEPEQTTGSHVMTGPDIPAISSKLLAIDLGLDTYLSRWNIACSRVMVDLKGVLRSIGNPAWVYWQRGRAHAEHKDYNRAIAAYTEALRIDPEYVRAYVDRGHALLWTGDEDRASADYLQALQRESATAPICYCLGLAHYNQGAFAHAIASYTEALRIEADFALAQNGRGLAFAAQGDYDQAIADFTAALRADPKYAAAYNNRGCVHSYKGSWQQAASDLAEAVRLDGRNTNYLRSANAVRRHETLSRPGSLIGNTLAR